MSKMYDVYQDENDAFIEALFPNESGMQHYIELVKELKCLLSSKVAA
jgi:hypothetical protein